MKYVIARVIIVFIYSYILCVSSREVVRSYIIILIFIYHQLFQSTPLPLRFIICETVAMIEKIRG